MPLLPYEACNLGSINLAKFVIENDEEPAIDYEGLKEVVWWTVRFLDDTIDMSKYPLPEIEKMVRDWVANQGSSSPAGEDPPVPEGIPGQDPPTTNLTPSGHQNPTGHRYSEDVTSRPRFAAGMHCAPPAG